MAGADSPGAEEQNGIDEQWVDKKMKEIQSKPHLIGKMDFALFSLI